MPADCGKIQNLITSLRDMKNILESGLQSLPDHFHDDQDREKSGELIGLFESMTQLIAELKKETDPYRGWQVYKNGESVCHYPYEKVAWKPCRQGIIIYDTDEGDYLLNGKKVLHYYNDDSEVFEDSLKKRINFYEIGSFGEIQLDGKAVYQGSNLTDQYVFKYHPRGLVFEVGNKLLLNGQELLYEGEFVDWQTVPRGVIVHIGKDWFFYDKWPMGED